MDISQFLSLLRVLVGALAGGCGSVAVIGAHWKQVQRKSGESAGLVSRMNGD